MEDLNNETLSCSFEVALITDTLIILVDNDIGNSVTSDANAVINSLQQTLEHGIGNRKVFYKDTDGRFDELEVINRKFSKILIGTSGQQSALASFIEKP
ncbi:hypothetical protein [Pseudoalteromonas sp. SR45-4]|uniref:hypothetical protein n=1 Tax=Pseudoalteromonas sp. SR45-4 TaxID=2760929 RepID=UPI0015FCAA65|nr:hypothetical protein [Pseudoalteromonas sp. SR45-4]MBB1371329.1 hypothetical protein [Pseudoalteromonas sp. SR45-4]